MECRENKNSVYVFWYACRFQVWGILKNETNRVNVRKNKTNEEGIIADFSDVLNRHKRRKGIQQKITTLHLQDAEK